MSFEISFSSMARAWLLAVMAISCGLEAAVWDTSPWYLRPFEIYGKCEYSLATCSAQEHLLTAGAQVALGDTWDLAIALQGAKTDVHAWEGSRVAFMGRYAWSSDVIGDPYSAVLGGTVECTFPDARHDIAIIAHGTCSAEVHVAIGRELATLYDWYARCWALGAVGCGNIGSPWSRFRVACDLQWPATPWRSGLYANYRRGYGHRSLSSHSSHAFHGSSFPGYASIAYAQCDVGGYVRYTGCSGSSWELDYSHRLWGRNAPRYWNRIAVAYTYPFGL